MAQSTFAGRSWPLIGLLFSCATAVEPSFEVEGAGGGGSGGGGTLGSSGSAGKATGSAGKASMAFGGTSTSGTAGSASAGTSSGGSAGGGSAGSSGGKASGGNSGSGGSATQGGSSASGGKGGSAGSTTGGSGGSAGSGSTGDCAEPGSGWVVQYWTTSSATTMPTGDLRIFNNSGASVSFTALELRHYFTNEETATMSFVFSTFSHNFPTDPYYRDEGGANVLSHIAPLSPPKTNASQFISIEFNATPGSFGNNEWAQLGFYASLSMYPMKSNQANDYTYIGHPTTDPGSANKTTGWQRTTLYVSGELVWGCEP